MTLLGPFSLFGTISVDDISGRLTFVFSPWWAPGLSSFLNKLDLLGMPLLYNCYWWRKLFLFYYEGLLSGCYNSFSIFGLLGGDLWLEIIIMFPTSSKYFLSIYSNFLIILSNYDVCSRLRTSYSMLNTFRMPDS